MTPQEDLNLEGIAIIGMAGRFPGARTVAEFWANLLAGKDSISHFTPAELEVSQPSGSEYVAARGVLEDIALFDADFFAIAPREADRMDPQHRLFLEACSNALEDGGYNPHAYPGEIGLFAGCSLNTYLMANLAGDRAMLESLTANYQVGEFQTALGNDKDFLTTRAAYKLNLRGPVVSVQSACATSLVAVCQASQSLLNYQCDMALAGGVSATFPQHRGHVYTEGGMASRDGVCRPFDAEATGTVFGHGVGVVLLKRLEDAVRDGDHISAVIRGFAVNNDGSAKAGFMAPGVEGQSRVIAAAQAMAGIEAASITYIEAHGTATPLGDPIEVAALTKAFRASTQKTGFCALGTAKGNVGHLDSAAGVTGLIKTVLSLKHRTLPGLAHFKEPNPELALASSPFFIRKQASPWQADGPLRAGVSAFGVGGVNAHVVLEEAPSIERPASSAREQILCLSARSAEALSSVTRNLASHLEANPSIHFTDVAYTLSCGRQHHGYRSAFVAPDTASAIATLRSESPQLPQIIAAKRRVAFLFSGQGSQFPGMGQSLYATEPVYRQVVDACVAASADLLPKALLDVLCGNDDDLLQQTRFAQPALYATELALTELWRSWGVVPEAMIGHSLGEFVAATVAGVFTLHQAMRLVCLRGALMQALAPGAMLSVPVGEEGLAPFLTAAISVAALNSPRASVLSGPTAAIEAVESRLQQQGTAFRRLRTSHAFHSAMMQPMVPGFEAAVAALQLKAPSLPFVSTVTGTWITPEQAMSPAYWANQCVSPVRFSQALQTLAAAGSNLLVEVGPASALTSLTLHHRELAPALSAIACLPVPQPGDSAPNLQGVLAELWSRGLEVDWPAFYARADAPDQHHRVPLPTYPFKRKLHWVEPPPLEVASASKQEFTGNPNMTETPVPLQHSPAPQPVARALRLRRVIAGVFAELSGIDTKPEEMELQFLELGFDSLFLTQATQTLQRTFSIKLTFRQLMEQYSTIASLAAYVDSILPANAFPAEVPAVTVIAPAATAQPIERLLADQLAAMSELFAQQVATLRVTAGLAALPATTPALAQMPPALTAPMPKAEASEVKHGSFRPIDAKAQHDLDTRQQRYIANLISLYETRTPGSKACTAAARPRLADPRAVAGFRPQWKEMVYPLVTERARGSRLWDVDGNEYIDIVNGYGCIMFGHSPQFVVDAVRDQLDRGVAIGPQSVLAGEVAALLCELTGNERATFCNTGSEAVMAAMRVARTVTGRDKIVYFAGDYHGTFDEVLVRNTPRGSAPVAPGIPLANTTNVVVLEYGTEASLTWLRTHAQDLAAVLIEPVQTRNPGLQPMDFIRAIRQITEQSGTAMILDEVVTGFRLAPGGVQQALGIRADMCTYGKVIGGGHPIGVLSGKAMYLDALDGGAWQYGDDSGPEVGVTFFAGTFVRHPLALAAARSVLLHLKEQGPALQQELNRKTATLADSLDRFFAERGVPCRVHHFASWFYFTFPHDIRLGSLLYYAMRAKGIHIQEGYPCFLTTAHSQADLDTVERVFRETVLEMQQGGALPSLDDSKSTLSREPAMHRHSLPEVPARIPLTEPQREIFLAAALNDDANCAFNESLTLRLNGPIRRPDLGFALDAVIARHDALRSTISKDGEDLCFAPAFTGQTEFIDLCDTGPTLQQQTVANHILLETRTPFDLYEGPLLRAICFLLSDRDAVILLTAHHIVLDGWSANQLLEEVGKIYSEGAAALTGLAPLMPFSSYAVRESKRQADGEFAANERFWVTKFTGRSPRLELPLDRPRPAQKTYRGATYRGSLPSTLYTSLKQLSAKQGCTLYVTLLSAFQLLLHRLTGQDEVVAGISTAGQALYEGASLVGHCVNFLPMLSVLGQDETVQQHIRATRTALLDAYDHQEFTYGSLLRKLKLERDASRLPLIEVQFNLERLGTNVQFQGLSASIEASDKQCVNTDLFLNVVETATDLQFTCDFNTDLFDQATTQRWMALWSCLLTNEATDPTLPVRQIGILPAAEQEQIVSAWNQTQTDFGPFKPIHTLILQNAATHPQQTAVQCNGRSWTYAELAEYAQILARRLLREGLKPGTLVGICIERSCEMVGAMLAIMMAGGAYLPLDPKHPRERLATVMNDAGITLLLTGRDPNIDTTAKILRITGPQPQGTESLPATVAADSLAYVIYTSGSTGVPKGVAIEHAALMNLLHSMQGEPGFSQEDVLVAVTTLAFDIAGLELLLPLLTGGRLVIATEDQVQDGIKLLQLLRSSQATVLQATPGAWRLLIDSGWDRTLPLKVLCGGEALPRDLADKLLDRSDSVWNMYGPTETTIWSAASRVQRELGPLRMDKPIANTQFHVLDAQGGLVPFEVAGELFIGGTGLARGYWHRPELTAAKFIANSFGTGRLYNTGDRARRHTNGTIELMGRTDFQVKLRGYRIELGDIESVLTRHAAVREAVVIEHRGQLAAFFATNSTPSPSPDLTAELRAHLERNLPEYMVPASLIALVRLPQTPNGKVDRKALPTLLQEMSQQHEAHAKSGAPAFKAPVTELQVRLATIWREVLEVQEVGIATSIFELGADSLLIFRIAARAQREGLPVNATQIFQHRTIEALSHSLDQPSTTPAPKAPTRIGAASRESYRVNKVKLDA